MKFSEKIKHFDFWKNVAKIAIVFFILFSIASILIWNFNAVFAGNWDIIVERNFANGKWKTFLVSKLLGSLLYGIWMTNSKMTSFKKN